MNLNSRSDIKTVEDELRKAGYRLQARVNGPGYAVDAHFTGHVFSDINSLEDALKLCDDLDKEEEHGKCQKAAHFRTWMKSLETFCGGKYKNDLGWVKSGLAHSRRACCWSHCPDSFARRTKT